MARFLCRFSLSQSRQGEVLIFHALPWFHPHPALPRRGGGSQAAYGKGLQPPCRAALPSPAEGEGIGWLNTPPIPTPVSSPSRRGSHVITLMKGGSIREGPLLRVPYPRSSEDAGECWMRDSRSLKLLEEPKIVFVEEPDVIDPVLQHRQALGAHPKGEARVLFRIVPDEAIQGGIDHPRP
jgi:hypothetical protein